MLTTAFAPYSLFFLIPVILLPLLYVALTVAPRDAALHFFWFGLGLFLSGTYWIYISVTVVAGAPAFISLFLMFGLVLIMALWIALTGWLISRFSKGEPLHLLLVAPAAWVAIEWLRGWVFTGFPWLSLGYANVGVPLGGFAPLLGVYGVSFFSVLGAAALLLIAMSGRRLRLVGAAIFVVPWILGAALDAVEWTEPDGGELRTTILQAGIPQEKKWLTEQLIPTMAYYRNATLRSAESDLVVWPEVAIPTRRWQSNQLQEFLGIMRDDLKASGQTVAFGVFDFQESGDGINAYNSIALLEGDAPLQYYHKRHLVPFGEYFPVPEFIIRMLEGLELGLGDLTPGDTLQPLLESQSGMRFASAICYEDAYGAEQLYAFPEASLIINVSNDGWFGDSIAPHQHLQIARMRSLEVARPTVRSTNNGISAFIDEKGRIEHSGPQFQQSRMTRLVQPRTGTTPYIRFGNWPILVLCFGLLGFFSFHSRDNA